MGITVKVRLYEELSDYLPEGLRKEDFDLELPDGASTKEILTKYNIPENEVHLVLINGDNSLLDEKLDSGDRVSIYPIFESIDIAPIKKI